MGGWGRVAFGHFANFKMLYSLGLCLGTSSILIASSLCSLIHSHGLATSLCVMTVLMSIHSMYCIKCIVLYSNVFSVLYSDLLEFHICAFNFFLENSSWDCQQSPKFKIIQNWVYYLDLKIPTPLLPTCQVLSAKTPGIILDHSTSQ